LNLVFEPQVEEGYCPHCGSKITVLSDLEPYEPSGVNKTIEQMLLELGYNISLSRRGPNNWEIIQGSAKVNVSYHQKTGLIVGDAYLATLPKKNIKPIYKYLLQRNYEMESLTFSLRGQDIIISLLIYDQYLNVDSALEMFRHLFEKADYYDDILVEEYGALWKKEA
jgi:serine protease Do